MGSVKGEGGIHTGQVRDCIKYLLLTNNSAGTQLIMAIYPNTHSRLDTTCFVCLGQVAMAPMKIKKQKLSYQMQSLHCSHSEILLLFCIARPALTWHC